MLDDLDLRPLAELHGPERAVVSIYVTADRGLDTLRARVRSIEEILENHPDELEHFQQSLELATAWLESQPAVEHGRAVFACWAADHVSGVDLPAEVTPQIWFGHAPYVRPVAALQAEYLTFVLVLASNEATRLWVVSDREVEDAERVSGNIKNRVKKGGWSQQRYARRREKQIERYADDVVERLKELVDAHECDRIILLGSEEARRAIREAMPESMAACIRAEGPADLNETEDELIEQALEHAEESERREEQLLWEEVEERQLGGGHMVAVGPTPTLAALIQGRVDTLLLDQDVEVPGTGCRACEHVVHGTPQTCQSCGSADVFHIRLMDELVRRADLTSALVEFCRDVHGLQRAGGVAALLRY